MKLSNKGRYAVRALFDIAFYSDGGPTQVRDIATRQRIPPRFLEQIFQELKRAGIVGSKRGPQGGYSLAHPAGAISVGDVVRCLEGPISLGDGKTKRQVSAEARHARDVTESIFKDLSRKVEGCFDAVSVQDICSRATELGMKKGGSEPYVYVI